MRVSVEPTGTLKVAGKSVFPIGISNGPPVGRKAPNGRDGYAELAAAGVTFIRTGMAGWNDEFVEAQIAAERKVQDAAAAHGLRCWLWLGDLANFPPRKQGAPPSLNEQVLTKVVNAFKKHPGLLAWKGADEPRNPFRGAKWIRAARLVRAYEKIQTLDGDHPLVIIHAPRSPVSHLVPYRAACDITGADIYPISYPPGIHAKTANRDISLVGDITKKMRQAAGPRAVWMTLQIAWSGAAPTKANPGRVPRFPSLHEERFMAYQAIANGARGLNFFGGHMTQVATPADAAAGWNWSFWQQVLRPLVRELSSPELQPALVAPDAAQRVKTANPAIELVTRRTAQFLYVIAVRRGGTTSVVEFTGLPRRKNGGPITAGRVLFEYVQQPLPPPIEPGHQTHRPIAVKDGGFDDWFAPHDAHVYRFAL